MSKVPIKTARELGQKHKHRGVVVITLWDDGRIGWTSWGRSKADCNALKNWANEFYDRMDAPFED
ncbi:MAG: hypothetical protein K0U61_13660 [Alphaproteobacteria bacterium]|nr:hypothetical protein [Alphaproteobacteria bacterium]